MRSDVDGLCEMMWMVFKFQNLVLPQDYPLLVADNVCRRVSLHVDHIGDFDECEQREEDDQETENRVEGLKFSWGQGFQ